MSTIRRRTVTTSDGVALHVVEAGDPAAPPLLLIHGFAGSSRLWERQLTDPELTARHRVIAFDLRGHGASQTDLADEQITAADMDGHARIWSRDVDAVREGLEEPVIVGWSFGGAVTQSHIHAHGGIGDAAAVVLLSSPCVLGPVPAGDVAETLVPKEAIGALVSTAKGDAGPFKARVLARGDGDTSYDAADLALLEDAAAQCPRAVRSAMLGYAYDFRPSLAALPADERERMSVLVAEHDLIFLAGPMEATWEQAGIRTVAVPGEGHALAMRDPATFRERLLETVATSRPAR
jgi:pimeloyl-ACP methyl ester carboxylesterase